MAQIIRITSEALQATIRRLLPSQQGFGEDLQASNVIQPIIDLTPSAEGSEFRVDLQSALAFGSQTAFDFNASSGTLANVPGFWRITGVATNLAGNGSASGGNNCSISMTDGLATKQLYQWNGFADTSAYGAAHSNFDFVVFLRTGDSLTAAATGSAAHLTGSYRQVADSSGVLVDPVGFQPQ